MKKTVTPLELTERQLKSSGLIPEGWSVARCFTVSLKLNTSPEMIGISPTFDTKAFDQLKTREDRIAFRREYSERTHRTAEALALRLIAAGFLARKSDGTVYVTGRAH